MEWNFDDSESISKSEILEHYKLKALLEQKSSDQRENWLKNMK